MNFRGSAAVSAHEDRRSWTCIELTLLRTRFTDRPGAVRAKPRSRMSLKLEIHLRDRLRGRSSEVRRRLTEQEKVIAGLCVKPSDGLEPSTPSLPSSGRERTRVPSGPREGTKVLLDARIAVDCSTRPRSLGDRAMY